MDAQQVIQSNLWIELLKLGIFAIFVTSIIEVVKGVSARGIIGIFKDLLYTLWKNDGMRKESIMVLNFVIALTCCWAFDYGVIAKVIEPGSDVRIKMADWIDYIGTASLIYTGADTMFKKFSSMRNSWAKEKEPDTTTATPGKEG